jgi:hypothetical protein
LTQAFTFPAIILPAFIGAALLLAMLFGRRGPESAWGYRDVLLRFGPALAIICVALAVFLIPRNLPDPKAEAQFAPGCEVDMLVSRGNLVELWFNDWQHPSEQLPVVPGERHIYRFTKIPHNITLIRLDPTDAPDARIEVYSVALKVGDQVVRQFNSADLKRWTLHDVSPPKEVDDGLVMFDTTNDPILWSPVNLQMPVTKPERPSLVQLYYQPVVLGLMALLLAGLTLLAVRKPAFLDGHLPARYHNFLLNPWGAAAIALLVAMVIVFFQDHSASVEIGLEADMMLSAGGGVELWINDWQHPSEKMPVVPGERHVYRFQKLPREIHLVRLDPTDLANARIVIYGITIRSRTQVLRKFEPAELSTWTSRNLSAPKTEDGGLAFTSTNDDPIFVAPVLLRLPGGFMQLLAALIEEPDSPILLSIPVFFLVLLVRMSTRAGRLQAVMIALTAAAAYPVVLLVLKLNVLGPPGVRSAVGYAAYTGYAKANEHLATLLAMLVSIALGYGFAWLTGSRGETPGESIDEELRAQSRRTVWLAHAGVFAFLFLYYLPDLWTGFGYLSRVEYHPGTWDETATLTWSSMVNAGLLPFRDFWFPYSGSYIQLLPFPTGAITTVLHSALVLWILYLALFKLTGRRLIQTLVFFSLIVAPVFMNDTPGSNRYLLAPDVALWYAAISNEPRLRWRVHLPFAMFAGYAFFYEPTQIIYSGAGIAVHTVLLAAGRFRGRDLRERLISSWQILKQQLVCIALPIAAGICGAAAFYGANGMLQGLWDFEASIGDMGNYGSWPAELTRWVQPVLQPDSVFLMMFLLASYAAYRWFRLKGREDDRLGIALIVLSGTTLLVMQKQVSRPHIMLQLQVFPYVSLLVFGLIAWRERRPATRVVIAAFLGCILSITAQRGLLRRILVEDVDGVPHKIFGSMDALLHHRQEFAKTNATVFARSRFSGFDVENEVVDKLNQECGRRPEDIIYVLGDAATFYPLLNQFAPYDSNDYNESPIREQQRMLDWFNSKHPRFVIWPTDDLVYDKVPHAVRLPLIYSYVVDHYEFVRAIGPYHILMEKPPGKAPDVEYFRRVLSSCVDLGFIPSLARESEYAACAGDTSRCDAVLMVKYAHPPSLGKLTVDVQAMDGPFQIQFNVNPRQTEYVVNLNRLWFWNPLAKTSSPRITTEDAAASPAMEYRRERRPVLY